MAEVGIHFEYIVVSVFDRPFEAGDISGSQSELAFPFNHEQAFGKFFLQPANDVGRTVGRIVFDDQNVETFFQSEYCPDDIFDIFLLIVSRNYHNTVTCLHGVSIMSCKYTYKIWIPFRVLYFSSEKRKCVCPKAQVRFK